MRALLCIKLHLRFYCVSVSVNPFRPIASRKVVYGRSPGPQSRPISYAALLFLSNASSTSLRTLASPAGLRGQGLALVARLEAPPVDEVALARPRVVLVEAHRPDQPHQRRRRREHTCTTLVRLLISQFMRSQTLLVLTQWRCSRGNAR